MYVNKRERSLNKKISREISRMMNYREYYYFNNENFESVYNYLRRHAIMKKLN